MVEVGNLISYRPQWGLTGSGWLVLLSLPGLSIILLVRFIHPFLAHSQPLAKAEALILEGWVPDEVVKEALAEFERGNYQVLITTGLPLTKGYYLSSYQNFAELTAVTLVALGFPEQKLVIIPAPGAELNRTAASAVAVRDWLEQTPQAIRRVNIYSYGVHTRRSWLVFRRVLGKEYRVGAIASPCLHYNPHQWWSTSLGFKLVLSETLSYCYARLFSWQA